MKGYWMRNNQNGGWKWNENLYNINKTQYLPAAWGRWCTTSSAYQPSPQ